MSIPQKDAKVEQGMSMSPREMNVVEFLMNVLVDFEAIVQPQGVIRAYTRRHV